jgi:hypothetical protein
VCNPPQFPLEIIRGIITPAEWDPEGNVLAVSIAAFDEDKYSVIHDEIGHELLSFVRETVTVEGVVSKGDEAKSIQVKRYEFDLVINCDHISNPSGLPKLSPWRFNKSSVDATHEDQRGDRGIEISELSLFWTWKTSGEGVWRQAACNLF